MKELVICQGLPASGKTTYAKLWVKDNPKERVRVNRDEIRRMLGPYWIPTRENLVTKIENSIITDSLLGGYNVIVDATNLRGTQRFESILVDVNTKRQIQQKELFELTKADFTDVPVKTCIVRDKDRKNSVGEDVIINMYNKYLGNFAELIEKAQKTLSYNLEYKINEGVYIESSTNKPPEMENIKQSFDNIQQAERWLKRLINSGGL